MTLKHVIKTKIEITNNKMVIMMISSKSHARDRRKLFKGKRRDMEDLRVEGDMWREIWKT